MNGYERALSALIDISYTHLETPPQIFPPLQKHPFALDGRQIIHPFLGEMGLEVRGFLGSIEPWLRSGWIIPARRPSLYPKMTAFDDPVYFERVDAIKAAYGLREMVGRLQKVSSTQIAVATEVGEDLFRLTISGGLANDLHPVLAARRDLRRAFFDRYGHDRLLPTRWHENLSSQSYADDDFEETARRVIAPSYLPPVFESPPFEFPRHIGIQLRNLPTNPLRNSDPERMEQLARQVVEILRLPLVVYGRETDFSLPDVVRTIDLLPAGTSQLAAELAMLKNCALMIAPDSGWADLMGWLRVPTLLERQFFPWGFEGLRPFAPRMVVADDADLRASIQLVTAADAGCVLPDCRAGEAASEFLNPNASACKVYWQDFVGCGYLSSC